MKKTQKEKLLEIREKLKNLTDEEKAKLQQTVGVVTIEGHVLSSNNTMLIAFQNPKSSVVGGYRQWLKAGRHVMKGESGMVIWVPANKKKKEESEEQEKYFFVSTVFDISQTIEKNS